MTPPSAAATRRQLLAAALTAAATLTVKPSAAAAAAADGAAADDIEIVADEPGSGTAEARLGDLLLFHYTATVEGGESAGVVFDTTRGRGLGLTYRDGGPGVLRPAALRLDGYPVPGVCAGLQRGLLGMRAGGKRTVVVPPALAFGQSAAAAPYAVVPAGATVRYEIELLRLSRRGPDALMAVRRGEVWGGARGGQRRAGTQGSMPAARMAPLNSPTEHTAQA